MRRHKPSAAKRKKKAPERARNAVLTEKERDRLAWEAHERFIRSGIEIRDVYGKLDS